jgi:hypothetical protein
MECILDFKDLDQFFSLQNSHPEDARVGQFNEILTESSRLKPTLAETSYFVISHANCVKILKFSLNFK